MTKGTLTARSRPTPEAAPPPSGGGTTGTAGKTGNLQDLFLNHLRREKTPVTMFLVKGVKLQGIVTWFDNFSILLRRDGQSQLVYKHAISTIMPSQPVDVAQFSNGGEGKKQRLLQDVFLSRVRDAGVQVTMFLVNGVMLQGGSRLTTCSACCSSARASCSLRTSMPSRRSNRPHRSI